MTEHYLASRPIELSKGGVACRILPELGGAMLSLTIDGAEILRPSPDKPGAILQTANFPLVPFANRVADGRFEFRGEKISLPADPATPPHAHHGHGWRRPWQAVSIGDADAELAYLHAGGAWPWRYRASQRLNLLDGGIELTLQIENLADRPMPCGFGFHPYFAMMPDSYISAFAPSRLRADSRGIPSLLSPGLIGLHQLADLAPSDDLLLAETDQILVGARDWEVALIASDTAGWQFYLPADRSYFCIEPVSHRPDSFNSPGPIAAISPGSSRDWHFTIRRTR